MEQQRELVHVMGARWDELFLSLLLVLGPISSSIVVILAALKVRAADDTPASTVFLKLALIIRNTDLLP